jgi:hypothetical protein
MKIIIYKDKRYKGYNNRNKKSFIVGENYENY